MRSHYCGDINSSDIGSNIEISGWVHRRRDHGGVIFLDIRDLHGIVQVVFNPEFLTERNAVEDFNNQKRIILGGPRPATTKLKQIFAKVFPKAHIIKTGSTHAELVKYFTNCFLAIS